MTFLRTRIDFCLIFTIFLLLHLCDSNTQNNVLSDDLISAFGPSHCMHLSEFENIITESPDQPKHIKHEYANQSIVDELYDINPAENINKMLKLIEKEHQSPVAMINELCQINKLKNKFYVLSKDGPAHNLIFKVSLDLIDESGNVVEKYFGEGSRIKLAQRNAAEEALINTNYKHPVKKNKNQPSKDFVLYNTATIGKNPVTILHELGQKLDKPVEINTIDEGPSHQKIFKTTCVFDKYKGYGESTKKKMSKKLAAEELLSQLKLIPTHDPIFKSNSKNKKKRKGRRKIHKFSSFKNLGSQADQWMNTASDNRIVYEIKDNDVKSDHHINDIDSNLQHKQGKDGFKGMNEATSKTQLSRFAEISGIKIKFYDISKKNEDCVSFVRLTSKPHIICYGEAPNVEGAQEKCSEFAFNYLFETYYNNGTLRLENLQQSIKIDLQDFKSELSSKWPVSVFKRSMDRYEYVVDPVLFAYNMAKWKNNSQI